jgi:succinoglycan biosynthesis protein ExoM
VQGTLKSIASQRLPDGVAIRVVVADNDATDAARFLIEGCAKALDLPLRYVHAPERNISVARNACLDAVDSDWFVFIDDDELATPDWISSLLEKRGANQIVFGVSQALYAPGTSAWMIEGDFHSNRLTGNDAPWNGYTANVLINRAFVVSKGLRFATELGQTGGEDTIFFFEAFRAGAQFGYAQDALVLEETPSARASLRWLALRRFRAGQIHHIIVQREKRAARAALLALAKLAFSLVRAVVSFPSTRRAADHALRGMLHLGVVAASLGAAPYREYHKPVDSDSQARS